jgi:hypothetical protein
VLKDIDADGITREIFEYGKTHPVRPRPSKRSTAEIQAFGNIRVGASNSYLQDGADTGYACYSVGQTYTRTTGGSATCGSTDVLSASQRTSLINDVIPAALAVIGSLLQVDQSAGNLFLDSTYYNGGASRKNCAVGVPIPASYVAGSTGIPGVDYYVWITARPASSSSNLASALACNIVVAQTSPTVKYGRPLAGYINFNPAGLASTDLTNSFKFNRYVRVAVHELMHALGFSSFFYPHFSNDNGQYYTSPFVNITLRGGPVPVFTTPRVTKFAQDHYGCSSLTGLEMENGGGQGTANSHWEARLMNNDIMTGYADLYLIISNATLAIFRDMGWYRVNWGQAEPYYMGYQQGCSFALNKCNTWTQARTFCSVANARGCTVDRRAKGYCDYATGQTIPSQYQYFGDTSAGGFFIRDYCPITIGYSNGYCGDASSLAQSYDSIGFDDSRCFDMLDSSNSVQACLRHRCNGNGLELLLSGNWVACTNSTISWPGQSRTVTCDTLLCNRPQTTVDSPVAAPTPTAAPVPVAVGSPVGGSGSPLVGSGSPSGNNRSSAVSIMQTASALSAVLALFASLL